ncbi:hypothetical protein CEXT_59021 [Caerostris extrusa]|uniref:Uncharacterized protein n=1 Tax=Caerostris extrusa TaxID=172846 RepID=A0AAV4PAZ9_CAEEX|nr:hypothetical protein CEXT_59021 [Caerostris extrusa]
MDSFPVVFMSDLKTFRLLLSFRQSEIPNPTDNSDMIPPDSCPKLLGQMLCRFCENIFDPRNTITDVS